VKDLWFRSLTVDDAAQSASLVFSPYGLKHAGGLRLDYSDVVGIDMDRERDVASGRGTRVGWLGSVLLDELLPCDAGVTHEIALTGGRLALWSADVIAIWV
jgi:hypothetical protein